MWFLLFVNVCCVCFLFFCLLEAVCLLSFWFVLELLSLSIIPYFIFWSSCRSQRCLLQYVLVLFVSSLFLVSGVLLFDFRSCLVSLGVLIKLGVFPFMCWVYEVVVYSSWVVVWFISGLLKVPFFLLFYVRGLVGLDWVLSVLCSLGFLCLFFNFWKISVDWRYCWCHMMLSGSTGLVVVSAFCPLSVVFSVYCVYLVWSSLVLWYLSEKGCGSLCGLSGFVFLFLFVSYPLSLAVVYKMVLGISLLFSSFFVFSAWCLCTISEQLFLVYYYVSGSKVRSCVSLLSGV